MAEQGYDFVPDANIPASVRQGVGQAVAATKRRLRQSVVSIEEAAEVARVEALSGLTPARHGNTLSLTEWFRLFFGDDLGPLGEELDEIETLYRCWQNDVRYTDEFHSALDRLFGYLVDAAADQILADCRDDNLI